MMLMSSSPRKAGTQSSPTAGDCPMPAFAGMTCRNFQSLTLRSERHHARLAASVTRSPTSKSRSPPRSGAILDIAKEKLGIAAENLDPYGHYKAKVSIDYIKSLKDKKNGKLILVTAISPTPAGEGKTTTTVGLTDALNHIGKKAMLCLREPSLGPVVRHEGRRGRRRLRAGHPDGGHQPPLHRRLPRHHLGAQSALGADRQSHLLGQRARHRLRAASPGAASWT